MASFEAQVHRLVPAALNEALGPTGVPIRYATVLLLPCLPATMDSLSSELRGEILRGEDCRMTLVMSVVRMNVLALGLLTIGASAWLGGRVEKMRWVPKGVRIGICALPNFGFGLLGIALINAGYGKSVFTRILAASGVFFSVPACMIIYRRR